jgi:hypothetical protein
MPNATKPGVRITALALACVANAALFGLLWSSRSERAFVEAVPVMIWITATERSRPPPPPAPLPAPRKARAANPGQLPLPVVIAPAPERSTAITVPPIDWYAEGLRAARNAVPEVAREKPGPSLDSKPQALELPDSSDVPHRPGDSERGDGGVVITWINETCYYRSDPLENMMGDPHKLKLPVCKARSMKERQGEKRAEELEELAMPKYLREPLP